MTVALKAYESWKTREVTGSRAMNCLAFLELVFIGSSSK